MAGISWEPASLGMPGDLPGVIRSQAALLSVAAEQTMGQ